LKTIPIPVKFGRQGHSCNFYVGFGPILANAGVVYRAMAKTLKADLPMAYLTRKQSKQQSPQSQKQPILQKIDRVSESTDKCITAFISVRTNLSPFTKGCRERDASM
jgi:hypothetical protein